MARFDFSWLTMCWGVKPKELKSQNTLPLEPPSFPDQLSRPEQSYKSPVSMSIKNRPPLYRHCPFSTANANTNANDPSTSSSQGRLDEAYFKPANNTPCNHQTADASGSTPNPPAKTGGREIDAPQWNPPEIWGCRQNGGSTSQREAPPDIADEAHRSFMDLESPREGRLERLMRRVRGISV